MPKPVVVLFADSHLAPRAWAYRPIEGDSYYALEQIVEFAIKHKVEAVIGAGDLLDKQVNRSGPIAVMHRMLDSLEKANIRFHYVQGQHELDDVPWFDSHRWALHLHGCRVNLGGKNFYGLDYQPAGKLQEYLAGIAEETDVLVCHQVWAEFMGSIASPQGGMGDVPIVPVVFTGDYHVYKQVHTRGKDGQEILVISPGSTCMQDISEPAEKFFVVMLDDGTFKKVRLKTRPFLEWDTILTPYDLDGFVSEVQGKIDELFKRGGETGDELPDNIRKPILRVTYSHRLPDVQRRVNLAVKDQVHVFWKELVPEKPEIEERRRLHRAEGGTRSAATMETMLPEFLAAHELGHLQTDALRLLQAENVEDELRRMREEALS